MGTVFPRPTGELQGENVGNLPNRGTGTGLNGDTYGANLTDDATNRICGISSDTQSHDADARPGVHNQSDGGHI